MDILFDYSLTAIRWLQSTLPQLEPFFQYITLLGNEEFYLALFPLFYWSIDKQFGRRFAYVFLVGNALNGMVKHALRQPRPFWLDDTLNLAQRLEYGLPSAHTQNSTLTFLFLATWLKRPFIWLLALALILLIGISRLYLGQHFIQDIVIGYLLGLLVLIGYFIWKRRAAHLFRRRIMGFRLMIAVLVPLGMAVLYILIRLLIGAPDLSVPWANILPDVEIESLEFVVTGISSLFGAGIGLVLEPSRIRFNSAGALWQRAVRYLLGIIVAVAIWYGLGEIFPREPLWLAVPLRFFRYTALTIWITYYAPWAFVQLRLAKADPEPEIDLTIAKRP